MLGVVNLGKNTQHKYPRPIGDGIHVYLISALHIKDPLKVIKIVVEEAGKTPSPPG